MYYAFHAIFPVEFSAIILNLNNKNNSYLPFIIFFLLFEKILKEEMK